MYRAGTRRPAQRPEYITKVYYSQELQSTMAEVRPCEFFRTIWGNVWWLGAATAPWLVRSIPSASSAVTVQLPCCGVGRRPPLVPNVFAKVARSSEGTENEQRRCRRSHPIPR